MCIQFLHPHSIISFHFSIETLDRSNKQPQRWFMRIYQVFTDSEKRFSLLHKVMSWFLTVMSFTWSLSWQRIYKYSVVLESTCEWAPSCLELDWKPIIAVFENLWLSLSSNFKLSWARFFRNCKISLHMKLYISQFMQRLIFWFDLDLKNY